MPSKQSYLDALLGRTAENIGFSSFPADQAALDAQVAYFKMVTDLVTQGKPLPVVLVPAANKAQQQTAESRITKVPESPPPSPGKSAKLMVEPRNVFRRLEDMELLTPDEIGRLTPPERLALIAQLWDSLDHEQLPLTAAQQAELDRRLDSLDDDRRNGVTWSALKAELEQRCP